MAQKRITCYFHPDQLLFKPKYEWAFGLRLKHPESTKRAETIYKALKKHPQLFELKQPNKIPMKYIRETHRARLITLYNTASELTDLETFYTSVFPKLNSTKVDPINIRHAGCFCFDSGTPLDNTVWKASSWSAACSVEAANQLIQHPDKIYYALSRPPGHHATQSQYGGYCYLNNTAIAAKKLRKKGRVVILDLDFHHGNGTQDIFYHDDQVMTISLHGDPRFFFPFFWGYPDEAGQGKGLGYNLNFIFQKNTQIEEFHRILVHHALPRIEQFQPDYLVVAMGFDSFKEDPVGDFLFETQDYFTIAQELTKIKVPTMIVQEGGYSSKSLGLNAVSFLKGFLNS
ncbi:histone deacetylase family protein [bacterium]|nr:histone deacetylase family protein [bacterium]